MDSETIKKKFNMKPHPEGGWFAELWQSSETQGERHLASHIYYLLKKGKTSAWHRLTSEEIWLWHSGGNLTLTLGGNGTKPQAKTEAVLGEDLWHCLIPANTWQRAIATDDDTLVSCVVSPAYSDDDWEMIKGE